MRLLAAALIMHGKNGRGCCFVKIVQQGLACRQAALPQALATAAVPCSDTGRFSVQYCRSWQVKRPPCKYRRQRQAQQSQSCKHFTMSHCRHTPARASFRHSKAAPMAWRVRVARPSTLPPWVRTSCPRRCPRKYSRLSLRRSKATCHGDKRGPCRACESFSPWYWCSHCKAWHKM